VIVIDNGWVAVFGTASTACTVNEQVWLVVGVPEIVPVLELKLSPAHRVPVDTLNVTGAVQ
jgi:hypothetical protein